MGRPKALLDLGGSTLLERQASLLRTVLGKVCIVGWLQNLPPARLPRTLRDLPRWRDELPNRGPLGGIYTALKKSKTEYILCLSCDLPFVTAEFLRYLCRRARRARADVTVPEAADRHINPVCAVYRRRALQAIRASLDSGENKITRFYPAVRCEVLPWTELKRAGFPSGILDNMNTPQEYEKAKKRMKDEG